MFLHVWCVCRLIIHEVYNLACTRLFWLLFWCNGCVVDDLLCYFICCRFLFCCLIVLLQFVFFCYSIYVVGFVYLFDFVLCLCLRLFAILELRLVSILGFIVLPCVNGFWTSALVITWLVVWFRPKFWYFRAYIFCKFAVFGVGIRQDFSVFWVICAFEILVSNFVNFDILQYLWFLGYKFGGIWLILFILCDVDAILWILVILFNFGFLLCLILDLDN